jgi:hypothetical protein
LNNISVISWRSVLLVGETGENPRPVTSHWQTLSHNVVHLPLIEIRTRNITDCIGSCKSNYHTMTTTTVLQLQKTSTKVYTDKSTKVYTDKSTKVYTDKSTKIYTDKSTKVYTDKSTKVYTDKSTKVYTDKTYENCRCPGVAILYMLMSEWHHISGYDFGLLFALIGILSVTRNMLFFYSFQRVIWSTWWCYLVFWLMLWRPHSDNWRIFHVTSNIYTTV